MAKILLVDNDQNLVAGLKQFLEEQSYQIEAVQDGEDALQMLSSFHYDAIVLDWNLPGMSGEAICKEYRRRGGQTPIIFLTGQNDIEFLERGLAAGADDYLTKPFAARELAARLRSLLRRRQGAFEAELQAKGLLLKPEMNLLTDGNEKVTLRPKETALLEFLLRNPNKIFSAQQLLDMVWSSDSAATSNTVRTWMGLLRQKLSLFNQQDLIKTIPGAGYILER